MGVFLGPFGGPGWSLTLNGSINYRDPYCVRSQGNGVVGGEQWIYDYNGYVIKPWPNGINQVPAMTGSVVRTVPHSSGSAALRPPASSARGSQCGREPRSCLPPLRSG